jgi:hypothetical protein
MKNVVRTDGDLGAPGRGKDDRVISAGLATILWKDHLQLRLAYARQTRAKAKEAKPASNAPLARNVQNYLRNFGIVRAA